ncbi:hypothetical protein IHE44_0005052 [Lamprotornis superbus]|uniref:Serine/threonine-protein phosphatase n=1 Tax=Lamprotornis superbus TaxID=245042 RepID=A0A835NYJ7_9PASS|nr:hypothetical protein IHE44_0005052 [Lamprotornis superbus]
MLKENGVISLDLNGKVIRAAILIQKWYRFTMARLEMRRRYSLSIFQSIEYADEQDQLQLSNFFTFMLDHCTHPDSVSQIFTSPSAPQVVDEDLSLKEFEKKIDVPDSYYGPRLSFPLTVEDANALLHAFRNKQLLHARYVLQLLSETRRVLKEMPNITHLSTSYSKEITVCGDLHGNLDDLLLIFYKNGLPSEQNRYVFNGDFVDRGKNSMEILIILFAFLLIYPNDLHLNRGNHEDYIMNLRRLHSAVECSQWCEHSQWLCDSETKSISETYGFTKEVSKKYKLKSLMRPPKSVRDRQNQTKRIPTTKPSKHIANQHVAGKTQHNSSPGFTESSGSNLPPDPALKEWKQVITIFSASNYYEEGSNRGAYIKLNPELIPRFVQYQVSKFTRRKNLRERVGTIESSALKSLREKIYAHKSELTSAFAQYDTNGTGRISVNDWAAAMESVLQLELPWRMLRSQLAQMNPDGEVDFMSCFYDLKMGQPIKEAQPALAETLCRYRKDLEIIFNIIDKDHSGLISLEEFSQTWRLFTSHLGIDVQDDSIDNYLWDQQLRDINAFDVSASNKQVIGHVHDSVHVDDAPDAVHLDIREERQDKNSFHQELPVLGLGDVVQHRLHNHIKSSNLIVSSKGPKSILGYQKLIFQDSEQLLRASSVAMTWIIRPMRSLSISTKRLGCDRTYIAKYIIISCKDKSIKAPVRTDKIYPVYVACFSDHYHHIKIHKKALDSYTLVPTRKAIQFPPQICEQGISCRLSNSDQPRRLHTLRTKQTSDTFSLISSHKQHSKVAKFTPSTNALPKLNSDISLSAIQFFKASLPEGCQGYCTPHTTWILLSLQQDTYSKPGKPCQIPDTAAVQMHSPKRLE